MEKKLILKLIETAKELLQEEKHLNMGVFLELRKGGIKFIEVPVLNDDVKPVVMGSISKMLSTGEFKSFVIINEAWCVKRNKEEGMPQVRVSKCEDRMEVISVFHQDDLGKKEMKIIPFKRLENGEILFEEMIEDDCKVGGRMSEIWK